MKLTTLLLSASAALCLALPAASWADPPSDKGSNAGGQGKQHQQQGGQNGRQNKAAKAAGGQAGPGSVSVTTRRGGQAGQGQNPGAGAQQDHPAAGFGATANQHPTVSTQTFQTQQAQRRVGPNVHRQPAPPPLADWSRTVRGPDRDQAAQQWRQGHHDWDSRTPWRGNTDWWRGDSGFRLFSGARIGFFFIPEMGYVSVPQEYQHHYWRAGDTLPNWFWRYQVRDYDRYGLPQPPDGCVWVWLDGDVALMDTSDGYILDIVHNLW